MDRPWPTAAVRIIAILLAGVAAAPGYVAWSRWRTVEHAIRSGQSSPPPRAHGLLSVTVALAAAAAHGSLSVTVALAAGVVIVLTLL